MAEETILIVDDTPANLHVLAQLLKQHGYRTRPMPNGLRALSSTRRAVPDLILLDIMMPDMDGYEVCAELKADERTRHIPVIFISALDDTFDKVKAFNLGGVDYITKPFQEAEVLARVKTHLSLRRLQQELQYKNEALQQANDTLEEKVESRTTALQTEIEQRKQHQQEKDRLFELAQQQSEQLRSMTQWLIEAQQTQRKGLSLGLEQQIQQKIKKIQANQTMLKTLLGSESAPQIVDTLTSTNRHLADIEAYIQQLAADLDKSEADEQELREAPLLQLSSREQQVLQLLVEGKTPAEISRILTVTPNTIYTYFKRIRQKLNVPDMPGLVRFALEHHLFE